MNIEKIGVIGAGVMGTGLAQDLAQTGHRVILLDITDEILDSAEKEMRQNIRLQKMFSKNDGVDDPDEIFRLISLTTDYPSLTRVDFIIENVVEKWDIKKQVYSQLDAICPKHCIFASNTSAIPITRIASATQRRSQVIGIHFMNPVPMKKTVEVIPGRYTSDDTIEITKTLLCSMNKNYIIVNDSPGFVSNRVLMLTINEAIFLLYDKVAPAKDIDRIFTSCLDHKMGPLETADLIGLDTVLYSLVVLYDSFKDSKFTPCPLLTQMVGRGLLGRKSGKGFYTY